MIDAPDPTWTTEQCLAWADLIDLKAAEYAAILPILESEIERRTRDLAELIAGLEAVKAALNAYNHLCRTASERCQQN